jgi:hypothetical protein
MSQHAIGLNCTVLHRPLSAIEELSTIRILFVLFNGASSPWSYPGTISITVISGGAKTRIGGPQTPAPLFTCKRDPSESR